jgi:hypothetical protein
MALQFVRADGDVIASCLSQGALRCLAQLQLYDVRELHDSPPTRRSPALRCFMPCEAADRLCPTRSTGGGPARIERSVCRDDNEALALKRVGGLDAEPQIPSQLSLSFPV